MKELKNKIDSIRRALKTKNISVPSAEVENKILELCPDFPDDWCSDIRTEIIKALISANQSAELTPAGSQEIISVNTAEFEESISDSEIFQSITPLEAQSYQEIYEDDEEEEVNTIAPLEVSEVSHSLAVTNTDKQALVSTQSMALGFELSEQECLVVADSVDDVFSDYSSFLTSVTGAIRGYVDHRFDEVETALDTNADVVRSHIADRATKLNQKVENFSSNVRADIGGIRQHIKSSQANILSRFTLPGKAG